MLRFAESGTNGEEGDSRTFPGLMSRCSTPREWL